MSFEITYLSGLLNLNTLSIGLEIVWIAVSAVLALTMSENKRDIAITFPLMYTVMVIIGLAHLKWVVVLSALIGGNYYIKTRDR